MNKILLLFLFLLISNVYGRLKGLTSFNFPTANVHPYTNQIWRCGFVASAQAARCRVPGVYLVFGSGNQIIERHIQTNTFKLVRDIPQPIPAGYMYINHPLGLKYIGRSIDDVKSRINANLEQHKYQINDIVCYMRFPRVFNGRNFDVTPTEQMLLQAFASTSNSCDNQGYCFGLDLLFNGINNFPFNILQTLYNMNLGSPYNQGFNYALSQGVVGVPIPGTLFDKNNSKYQIIEGKKPSLSEIFEHGIPYDNGQLLVDDDFCSDSIKFKPAPPGYLDHVKYLISTYYSQSTIKSETMNVTDYTNDSKEPDTPDGAGADPVTVGLATVSSGSGSKSSISGPSSLSVGISGTATLGMATASSSTGSKSSILGPSNLSGKSITSGTTTSTSIHDPQCQKQYSNVLTSLRGCQKGYNDILSSLRGCQRGYDDILSSLRGCQRGYDDILSSLRSCQNQYNIEVSNKDNICYDLKHHTTGKFDECEVKVKKIINNKC